MEWGKTDFKEITEELARDGHPMTWKKSARNVIYRRGR